MLDLTHGKQKFFDGDYDYYISRVTDIGEKKPEEVNKTREKKEQKKEREKIRESQKLKRDINNIEKKIDELELEIEEIDKILSDPKIYDEPDKPISLGQKRTDLKEKVDRLMEEWEELHEV